MTATRNGQMTRYTLDVSGAMANVLVENDSAGTTTAYYVHGLGLISRITPSGDARFYHYDTIGSTVALTDAAGNVTDSYAYDPFGQVLNAQGTVANPFRYVGQFGVMQEGNGLQFMRARYYEAEIGRFLNKDPLSGNSRASQTLNAYTYVLNNPVKLVDFTGLSAKEGFVQNGILISPSIMTLTPALVLPKNTPSINYSANTIKASYATKENNSGLLELSLDTAKEVVLGGAELYENYKTGSAPIVNGLRFIGKVISFVQFWKATEGAYSASDQEVLAWIQKHESTNDKLGKLESIAVDNNLNLNQFEKLPQQTKIDYVKDNAVYKDVHFYQSEINLIKPAFGL